MQQALGLLLHCAGSLAVLARARVACEPRSSGSRARLVLSAASALVAADLDGVVVDAQAEHMRVAWLTARELWPEAFELVSGVEFQPWRAGARRAWASGEWAPLQGVGADGLPNWLDAKVRLLRPVLKGEADAVLLMRLCADEAAASIETSSGARPLSVGEIASNWDEDLREMLLARYGVSREEVLSGYVQARERWIEKDTEGWICAHELHTTAASALRQLSAGENTSVYIMSTRPKRFVSPLLHRAGIELESSCILELTEDERKTDVLHSLLTRHPGAQLTVVGDNAETLRQMAADVRLLPTKFCFAAWGYSTPQQQAIVAMMPRVQTFKDGAALLEICGQKGGVD